MRQVYFKVPRQGAPGLGAAPMQTMMGAGDPSMAPRYCDEKVANRNVGISGGRSLTGAVTRRAPILLDTMVPRTGGYAYDVGVWDLSVI